MKNFVFIKTGKTTLKVIVDDIMLIKGLGNYVQIHTTEEKKYTSYHSLDGLLDKLPDEFMRIHNSYIVNLYHIQKIEDNHVHLNNHKIPISSSNRKCLDRRIDEYRL